MRLIEKISGVYDALPLRSIKVPEWGVDVEVFYKPMTGLEYDTVREVVGSDATGSRHNAQIVILKSLDNDGKRLFKNEDLEALSSKGFLQTIGRVASAMTVVTSPEQIEKN